MAKNAFNAEALKRNKFWIVLGLFTVLWIVAAVMVKMAAGGAKKKAWETAKTSIENAKKAGPKTEAFQTPWNTHGKRFRDHKDVIWGEAWQQQYTMYDWPQSMPRTAQPLYTDDYFAPKKPTGEVDIVADGNNRSTYKQDWYAEQFAGLDQYVQPAEFNGGFLTVFPMQQWERTAAPTREEIWLAQEDFWVRREMLLMIRQALDAMALLKDVTPKEAVKEKLPAGILAKKVFRNATWEITLLIELAENGRDWRISDQSTIKNVNPAERTMVLQHPKLARGLPFRLVQGQAVAPMEISGEPLAFSKETTLKKKYNASPVDLKKPFYLEQVLDWEISPIRRIDALDLGRHSHRTVTVGLKINEDLKKLDPEQEGEAALGGFPPGADMPPGGMPATMPGMDSRGGPGGAGAPTGDLTRINKINRQRYHHVTPQCRHLPVAMRLIIDQAHIHDILTAVANSRLRIQVTQVSLHHVTNLQQGSATAGGPGMAGAPPAARGAGDARGGFPGGRPFAGGRPPSVDPGSMGGRPFIPGGMGSPPGGPGGAPGAPTEMTSTFQDTAQLVELSIFGIASLYERFPPRPKQDGASPGMPGAPGGPALPGAPGAPGAPVLPGSR